MTFANSGDDVHTGGGDASNPSNPVSSEANDAPKNKSSGTYTSIPNLFPHHIFLQTYLVYHS